MHAAIKWETLAGPGDFPHKTPTGQSVCSFSAETPSPSNVADQDTFSFLPARLPQPHPRTSSNPYSPHWSVLCRIWIRRGVSRFSRERAPEGVARTKPRPAIGAGGFPRGPRELFPRLAFGSSQTGAAGLGRGSAWEQSVCSWRCALQLAGGWGRPALLGAADRKARLGMGAP